MKTARDLIIQDDDEPIVGFLPGTNGNVTMWIPEGRREEMAEFFESVANLLKGVPEGPMHILNFASAVVVTDEEHIAKAEAIIESVLEEQEREVC